MTIHQVLSKHHDIETDLLLSHVLRKPKEFLYTHPEYKLTTKQLNNLTKLVKRRQNGEPIAYILGYKYFYGLKFKTNKHVLIPRPETEWLVNRALWYIGVMPDSDPASRTKNVLGSGFRLKAGMTLLDMGTGSGCIPISIAKSLALNPTRLTLSLTASDISPKALTVAKTNAKTHKVKIKFVHSDIFEKIKGKFDIVTANLPYVPQARYKSLYKTLRYEPKNALTDGTGSWELYQKFFAALPHHLNLHGTALMEIDETAKPALTKMINHLLPTYTTTFINDSFGRMRYLTLMDRTNKS